MHAPDRALTALVAPDAEERFSVTAGEALWAVDLRGAGAGADDAWRAAAGRLARLPCVTAAVTGPESRALAAHFDVAVTDEAALEAVAEGVRRSPLAALVLVERLRQGEGEAVHPGLVAESWAYATLQAGPEHARWLAGARRPAPAAEAAAPLRVERDGNRLCLVLARPERRNALGAGLRDALCEALSLAEVDASIRRIELSAEGPDFCAGGDLAEFGTRPDPATAHAVRSTRSPARRLAACAPRAYARVHGACVGAGVELAAFCTRVVAREDAFFQLPELAMGLVPGAGGTVSLPRRIGRQRTAWLALTGARIDAATARRFGLVDALEPGG